MEQRLANNLDRPPPTAPASSLERLILQTATAQRVLEFFTANIRNPHTRKAYATAVRGFAAWTDTIGIAHLRYVAPLHVAAYIEQLQSRLCPEPPPRRAAGRESPQGA